MTGNPDNTTQFNAAPLQQPGGSTNPEKIVIPVIEEEVIIGKRVVETGKVRVVKTVQQEEQLVDLPLLHEEFNVERVAINEYVDVPPAVRYEGDTTVFPVVKEVLVIEKKLVLVEEVHITKRLLTTNEPQKVTIRKEEILVEHRTNEPERSA